MKHLKRYESYNDDYNITKIHRNSVGIFRRCDGILYKLGNEKNTFEINVDKIQHTTENTFYQDQIERYVKYLENDGILETFPVEEVDIASNLKDMIDWLDDIKNFDEGWDLLHGYELYDKFYISGFFNILDKEECPEYNRINIRAKKIDDVFPYDDLSDEENKLLEFLTLIFEYFDENKEYYLLDFNHRFCAVKELDKTTVLIEIME